MVSDDARQTRIAAVLLSYNHAHTIGRSIESILKQTEHFDVLLVSDDCSTDASVSVIRRYAGSDKRVRLIQPSQNLGMSGNANFAVSQVDADYIALLHHDDQYMPDAFRKWKNVLDTYPDVAFVYSGHLDENGNRSFIDPHDDLRVDGNDFLFRYLLPRWACPVWGSGFIRRSAWDAVGGMKTKYGSIADVYLWTELASRFAVGYVPEPLFQIFHDIPEDYPEDYIQFSWARHSNLINIHGDFRQSLAAEGRLTSLSFLQFRLRATMLTSKWLVYSIYKRKWKMLAGFGGYQVKYEIFPLRLLSEAMRAWAYSRGRRSGIPRA